MGLVAMKCPSCGADIQLDDSREFGFCNFCGTKVMQDKIVVEHQGSVKIDQSDEVKNLYELARRAKNDCNSENAQKYYDMLLLKDSSSWEANFYTVYYKSMNCKIAEIQNAANRLIICEDTVLQLIKDNITSTEEQKKAVEEMATQLISIADLLYNAEKNHCNGNYTQKTVNSCFAARNICYYFGDRVIEIFGDDYGSIAVPCWETGITMHNGLMSWLANKETNITTITKYANKIQKFDSSYQMPSVNTSSKDTSSGGCYVATAVYGSYDCPQVWTLRRFRDNELALTWYGRLFIYLYYAISPTLVKWFGETNWFKNMWRGTLDKMVKNLKAKGVEDTPYQDKNWR